MDKEEKGWMHRQLQEKLEEQMILERIDEMVKRRKAVNAREIAAYETLLALYPDPDTDTLPLAELENLVESVFGALVGDGEEGVVGESSHQPWGAEQGDSVVSERVSEEEVALYRDCSSLMEIADRCAELNDDTVYVAKVTDIAEAKGFTNMAAQRPRKQLWLRVYSALQKSEFYDYGGRGTGRFTRRSHPIQSA